MTIESISKLRKICQETREDQYFQMGWFPKHVTRRISIYFTKPCLKMGISANQATIISLAFTIVGGVFFILPDPRWWLLGALLCYGFSIFDCVDGEIARYKKTSSIFGAVLDSTAGIFSYLYILACITLGTFNSLHNNIVLIFGFLAVIAFALQQVSHYTTLAVAHRKGFWPDNITTKPVTEEPIVLHYGRLIYRALFFISGLGIIPHIFVVALIDIFVHPFTMFSFTYNARFIYLVVLGLGHLAGLIAQYFYDIAVVGKAIKPKT